MKGRGGDINPVLVRAETKQKQTVLRHGVAVWRAKLTLIAPWIACRIVRLNDFDVDGRAAEQNTLPYCPATDDLRVATELNSLHGGKVGGGSKNSLDMAPISVIYSTIVRLSSPSGPRESDTVGERNLPPEICPSCPDCPYARKTLRVGERLEEYREETNSHSSLRKLPRRCGPYALCMNCRRLPGDTSPTNQLGLQCSKQGQVSHFFNCSCFSYQTNSGLIHCMTISVLRNTPDLKIGPLKRQPANIHCVRHLPVRLLRLSR
jgi:hypothetical protein